MSKTSHPTQHIQLATARPVHTEGQNQTYRTLLHLDRFSPMPWKNYFGTAREQL